MSIRLPLALGGALAALLCVSPVQAAGPAHVGQCAATRVTAVGTRLQGQPGSGSAFSLANGVVGVSYDQVPAIDRSRPGDPVVACLASVERGCRRGETPNRFYRVTNRRTGASWQTSDSSRACGGGA